MKSLKSPVNRFGGKHYLTGWLAGKIPPHKVYAEPFAGAGHLLFSKLPSKVEILNDIDSHLINFFQISQKPKKCGRLLGRLAFMPYSRALWRDIRNRWKQSIIPSNSVQSAAEWFYLNRSTFSGDQKRGGFACPSITGRNPAQSYFNAIDGLTGVAGRMRGVTVECLDYIDCIRRYDSPDTLFYCDPPYYGSEHYYGKDFTQVDHHRLSELLHEVKGKVMITHYQDALYDDLYKGWHRHQYSNFKGSHKSEGEEKPKTVETLYTNFKPVGRTRSLFEGMNL